METQKVIPTNADFKYAVKWIKNLEGTFNPEKKEWHIPVENKNNGHYIRLLENGFIKEV